jgi:hypothetical protein
MNDPNYFLTTFKGEFNGNSTDDSGYGTLPAVEQNQTYVAYFNGMAGTGPELIDQTALFIKYLIDKDGNVVKPKSDNIALLNLYSNFESGKIATVLPQTATQTAANLIGNHTITDIGTIQPILITETGSNRNSFIPTMSFTQVGSSATGAPSATTYYFYAKHNTSQTLSDGYKVKFNTIISNPNGDYTGGTDSYYTVPFPPAVNGVNILFQVGLAVLTNRLDFAIQVSSDSFVSDIRNLPIEEFLPPSATDTNANIGGVWNDIYYYIATPSSIDETTYHYVKTKPYTFATGDKIRVWVLNTATSGTNIVYGTPNTTETFFTMTSNYLPSLQVTSSYWSGATFPTSSTPQYLTASLGLSNFLNNNFTQITPTASLSMSFSQIITPANIQPGDYIRFEYDPNKQSKIYNVGNLSDGRAILTIYPPIPTGSKLDHFVIYRIVKDGNYVIVNEPRVSGATLTGFLQPKYISQELKDNFSNIVNKLEADGLLNN